MHELGLPAALLARAVPMGAWDHCYPDSAFDPAVSTHYVNLPHWLPLTWPEIAQLSIGPDAQHSDWTWRDLAEAAADEAVHPYVRPYAAWVRERRSGAGGAVVGVMGPVMANSARGVETISCYSGGNLTGLQSC